MTDPSATVTIAAPADRAWALISDVRHWPDLLPTTVTSVTPVDASRPDGVGARSSWSAPHTPGDMGDP